MKRAAILLIFFLSFVFDIVFFDYDLSDIKHIRADVSEINNRIDRSLEMIFPFYFNSLGFSIKDCTQLSTYKPIATNIFERDALVQLHSKCSLKSILNNAKVSKDNFVDDVKLNSLEKWDKRLYLNFNCEKNKTGDLPKYRKINNGKELENQNIIEINSTDEKSIIFTNRDLEKVFFVKEILRANFNDDNVKDILLEISVADPNDNYVECINYVVFTRENKNGLMREKNIELKTEVK